jgi:hypothetical protein
VHAHLFIFGPLPRRWNRNKAEIIIKTHTLT